MRAAAPTAWHGHSGAFVAGNCCPCPVHGCLCHRGCASPPTQMIIWNRAATYLDRKGQCQIVSGVGACRPAAAAAAHGSGCAWQPLRSPGMPWGAARSRADARSAHHLRCHATQCDSSCASCTEAGAKAKWVATWRCPSVAVAVADSPAAVAAACRARTAIIPLPPSHCLNPAPACAAAGAAPAAITVTFGRTLMRVPAAGSVGRASWRDVRSAPKRPASWCGWHVLCRSRWQGAWLP